jgi:L-aspartate oxidase
MKYDVCIIGSGIAGMSAAIRLAENGKKVALFSGSELISGSTPMAQGGIAAVTDTREDSFHQHFEDTMKAGGEKNNPEAVNMLVHTAPEVISDLEKWEIRFYENRHKEGGHSAYRILNVGDKTGKSIAEGLARKIRTMKNITLFEYSFVSNLLEKKKNFGNSIFSRRA